MTGTAIVVPIRIPAAIERLRREEVEVARMGVPAHITILSPFLDSGLLTPEVIGDLGPILAAMRAFDVTFQHVRRWPPSALGDGVVWLEPEPAEPFVALTRTIWRAFPGCPPYGREDLELEAHLTIAIDRPERFDRVEAAAARHLPFTQRVAEVSLLAEGDSQGWATFRRFHLR